MCFHYTLDKTRWVTSSPVRGRGCTCKLTRSCFLQYLRCQNGNVYRPIQQLGHLNPDTCWRGSRCTRFVYRSHGTCLFRTMRKWVHYLDHMPQEHIRNLRQPDLTGRLWSSEPDTRYSESHQSRLYKFRNHTCRMAILAFPVSSQTRTQVLGRKRRYKIQST